MADKIAEREAKKVDLKENQSPQNEQKMVEEMVEGMIKGHQRDMKGMVLAVIALVFILFFVIGLALFYIKGNIFDDVKEAAKAYPNKEFLELILPIIGAFIIGLIAFLGMYRLRNVDEQIDNKSRILRRDLRTSVEDKIKSAKAELTEGLAETVEEVSKKVDEEVEKASKEVDEKVEKASKEVDEKVEKASKEVDEKVHTMTEILSEKEKEMFEKLEEFSDKYGWLLAQGDPEEKTGVFFEDAASVEAVQRAVATMRLSKPQPTNIIELTKRYVARVTKAADEIPGDCDDYHNLAVECGRQSLYTLACDVCEAGLKRFPSNIDLLVDWILYGRKQGRLEVITSENGPLERLNGIGRNRWNWRAFEFSIDYYLDVGKYEEAEEVALAYVENLPRNERSYSSLSDVYLSRNGGEDKAMEVLRDVVDNKHLQCSACASKLAGLCADMGQLEKALSYYDIALRESAKDCPNRDAGQILLGRAMVQDRMAFAKREKGESGRDLAEAAILDYIVAGRSNWVLSLGIMMSQIQTRVHLLATYFGIDVEKVAASSKTLIEPKEKESIARAFMEMLTKTQTDADDDEQHDAFTDFNDDDDRKPE